MGRNDPKHFFTVIGAFLLGVLFAGLVMTGEVW